MRNSSVLRRPILVKNTWGSGFVSAPTHDGRSLRQITPLDKPGRHIVIVLNPTWYKHLLDILAIGTILSIFFI